MLEALQCISLTLGLIIFFMLMLVALVHLGETLTGGDLFERNRRKRQARREARRTINGTPLTRKQLLHKVQQLENELANNSHSRAFTYKSGKYEVLRRMVKKYPQDLDLIEEYIRLRWELQED